MDGAFFLVMLIAIGWLAVWSVIEPDEPGTPEATLRRYARKRRAYWSPYDMAAETVPKAEPASRPDQPPWRQRRR